MICCCICLKKAEVVLCQVDKDDKNVALVVKGKKKDLSKVRCFACHKTSHYTSQCLNKKEKKSEPEVSASTEIAEFVERHEREFSLMTSPLGSGFLVLVSAHNL